MKYMVLHVKLHTLKNNSPLLHVKLHELKNRVALLHVKVNGLEFKSVFLSVKPYRFPLKNSLTIAEHSSCRIPGSILVLGCRIFP